MIERTDHRIASHCGEDQLLLRSVSVGMAPQAKTVLFVHGATSSSQIPLTTRCKISPGSMCWQHKASTPGVWICWDMDSQIGRPRWISQPKITRR